MIHIQIIILNNIDNNKSCITRKNKGKMITYNSVSTELPIKLKNKKRGITHKVRK